jgi:ssDNA-binding Zn-finger/Zn-ribbon topoisomerase 1
MNFSDELTREACVHQTISSALKYGMCKEDANIIGKQLCPKCQSPMVIRFGKDGGLFLGCWNFGSDKCDGVRKIKVRITLMQLEKDS